MLVVEADVAALDDDVGDLRLRFERIAPRDEQVRVLARLETADTIGYAPMFAALSVFDLIGAVVLIVCIRKLTAAEYRP